MTVLDQWGGVVWDNSACWSVRVRNKKCDMFVLTLIKLQIREEVPCRLKWGRYVGMRRFRVRGQRTPEVNKVALTALKYFIALISATIIS